MSGKHWQKPMRAVNWISSTRSLVVQAYLSGFAAISVLTNIAWSYIPNT